jgi:multicomponent Na+:H+ antiporter subunit C
MDVLGLFNYWIVIVLMMTGFYIVIARHNLIKKLIGLSIFQVSVFLLYITIGVVDGGTAPIVSEGYTVYSNPLPSVLILTAIVVGVATIALGLALVVRIQDEYGTIEEDEIQAQDHAA